MAENGASRGDSDRNFPMPKRYNILLVDDDGDLVEELSDALQSAGYRVAGFTDGGAALAAADRLKPDIALVDLKMKGISGFKVAWELARAVPPVPVVAMTGYYTAREHESLMKESGIRACLFKPFDFEVAARKLKSFLQGAGKRSAGSS
jgi:two-component system, NtrC family, sensor histidine kinase HydH